MCIWEPFTTSRASRTARNRSTKRRWPWMAHRKRPSRRLAKRSAPWPVPNLRNARKYLCHLPPPQQNVYDEIEDQPEKCSMLKKEKYHERQQKKCSDNHLPGRMSDCLRNDIVRAEQPKRAAKSEPAWATTEPQQGSKAGGYRKLA